MGNDEKSSYLTTTEAARLLNISPRTLENWRVTGRGPTFIRLSSKCVRYDEAVVSSWLKSNTYRVTANYG